jgi:hypothetical protein
MAEAEGKSKYQILQKLKRRRNTKTIAEIEQKYQIAEAEGKSKYKLQRQYKNTKL